MPAKKRDSKVDLENAQADKEKAERDFYKAEIKRVQSETALNNLRIRDSQRYQEQEDSSSENHRTFYFNKAVNDRSVEECIEAITAWARQKVGPIRIVINSPGGDVIEGLALYDTIQDLKAAGNDVTVKTIGMAASMGGILLQAGTHRVASPNAQMLIHEISSMAFGKFSEIQDEVAFSKRLQERLLTILSERSTLSAAQIKTRWTRKDWWLDADRMLYFGFIDAIE